MAKLLVAAFVFVVVAVASSADIPAAEGDVSNTTASASEDDRMCRCSGAECKCCVDFNLTFVDLGGPGCVKMNYLSKDEGLMVNVSYGDKLLHGGKIRSGGPTTSCMDILLDLAQMCATFTGVEATDDGMRACAGLAPSVLGVPHEAFQLGCFVMGPQGMRWLNSSIPDVVTASEVGSASPDNGEQNGSTSPLSQEEALIDAVNESAEEGIAWFSSFLGFNFGKTDNETSSAHNSATQQPITDQPPRT